jgi:endonuclease-3
MKKKSSPEKLLQIIENHIRDLQPPVHAFENSIRTTPFRILISVLLSSRTKDGVTLKASKALFGAADSPEKMLKLGADKISRLIYPVGFYRQKAANILKVCRAILERGGVPSTWFWPWPLTGRPWPWIPMYSGYPGDWAGPQGRHRKR